MRILAGAIRPILQEWSSTRSQLSHNKHVPRSPLDHNWIAHRISLLAYLRNIARALGWGCVALIAETVCCNGRGKQFDHGQDCATEQAAEYSALQDDLIQTTCYSTTEFNSASGPPTTDQIMRVLMLLVLKQSLLCPGPRFCVLPTRIAANMSRGLKA